MIETLGWWELGLAAAAFVLACSELAQLLVARRQGLTRNVSRVVTHGLVMAMLAVYSAYTFFAWRNLDVAETLRAGRDLPTANWTYMILGAIIAILVSYELVAVLQAFRRGRTRNISRMASHVVTLLVVLVLTAISMTKWDLYLDQVESVYREGIRSEAPGP